ncbi:hypothetical protein EV2_014637 [Malus domestica]
MITCVASQDIYIVCFVVYHYSVNLSLSDFLRINCNNNYPHHGSVGGSKLVTRGLTSGINASLSGVTTPPRISLVTKRGPVKPRQRCFSRQSSTKSISLVFSHAIKKTASKILNANEKLESFYALNLHQATRRLEFVSRFSTVTYKL